MSLSRPAALLQQRLGHRFDQPRLLEQALTHRSHSADHNERLEFLGDSVLNLAVSRLLYERLSQSPEGDLSRTRANLVKQDTLHALATRLGVAEAILLGEGELRTGGRQRPSILADALEAVIGAVYLDAGFDTACTLVQRLYHDIPLQAAQGAMAKDPKTELQEWLQARKHPVPAYRVAGVSGAAHQQVFDVVCDVPPLSLSATGQGPSRRAAEQAAAAALLTQLKNRNRP